MTQVILGSDKTQVILGSGLGRRVRRLGDAPGPYMYCGCPLSAAWPRCSPGVGGRDMVMVRVSIRVGLGLGLHICVTGRA